MVNKDINFNLIWKTIGEDKIEAVSRKLKGLQKVMCDFRDLTSHLKVPVGVLTGALTKAGVTIDKHGRLMDASTKNYINYTDAVEKIIKSHSSFANVMAMNTDLYVSFIRQGYKFEGLGSRIAMTIRNWTQGIHRFKMELLSVMFFGMQMRALGLSMLAPAMKLYGVTDLFATTLQVVMLPVMQAIYPILLWIALWLMQAPGWFKGLLGAVAIFLVVGGTIAWFGSQVGLFLGAIPGIIGKTILAFGKLAGAILHPRAALHVLVEFSRNKLSALKNIFWKGFNSIANSASKTKTRFLSSLKGMVMGSRAAGKGIAVGFGPIFWVFTAIIAALALLYAAWQNNWFGIRQRVGSFLMWFSGVYDNWIKPVLMYIITGVVALKNIIAFALVRVSDLWQATWLTMQLGAFTIWNAILTGIETFVNNLLIPIKALYDGISAVAGIAGVKLPEFPELDLSGFKLSTTEIKKELTDIKLRLSRDFASMVEDTNTEIENWQSTLDSFTNTLNEFGEAIYESGERIDAEKQAKEAARSSTSMFEEAINSLKSVVGNLIPGVDTLTTSLENNKTKIDEANSSVQTYLPVVKNVTKSIESQSAAYQDLNTSISDVALPAIKNITSDTGTLTLKMNSAVDAVNTLKESLESLPTHKEIIIDVFKTIYVTYSPYGESIGMQHGGIVTRPTLALLGEAGPEAVIPLHKYPEITSKTININVSPTYNISGVASPDDIREIIEEENAKLIDDLKASLRI